MSKPPPKNESLLTADSETLLTSPSLTNVKRLPVLQPQYPNLRIVRVSDLADRAIPETHWLISDWFPMGTVVSLYGEGGQGKTLLGQQLQTCSAAGVDFLGMKILKCRSVGFYCEDDLDELHRRQAQLNAGLNIQWSQLQDMLITSQVGLNNELVSAEPFKHLQMSQVFQELRRKVLNFGARLVVIDNIAETFGGNEIARSEVRFFISLLSGLAQEIRGVILLLGHPSKSGRSTGDGTSGSTAWRNSVRTMTSLDAVEIKVDREWVPSPTIKSLSLKKTNRSKAGLHLYIAFRDGMFVTTEDPNRRVQATELSAEVAAAMDKRFLACLARINAAKEMVVSSSKQGNYAPRVFTDQEEFKNIPMADIERTMRRLIASGQIGVGEAFRKAGRAKEGLSILKPSASPPP